MNRVGWQLGQGQEGVPGELWQHCPVGSKGLSMAESKPVQLGWTRIKVARIWQCKSVRQIIAKTDQGF